MTQKKFLAIDYDGDTPKGLGEPLSALGDDPEAYIPADGLFEAADMAMLLRVPLILTGEPGTGKTSAAKWLSHRAGLPEPEKYSVKSTTTGRDLLYSFDEVERFRDSQQGGAVRPLIDYIRFSPLGEAIIRAARPDAPLRPDRAANPADLARKAFGTADPSKLVASSLLPGVEHVQVHGVVLIDEFDKAPRDTPNDLLAEIENMAFSIPELGVRIEADQAYRPIVIITSNSEKSLPEPFLRRCIYFDIPFEAEKLAKIVPGRLKELGVDADKALFQSASTYFVALRDNPQFTKKPGTAEFLMWLAVLLRKLGIGQDYGLAQWLETHKTEKDRDPLYQSVCCLAKTKEDRKIAQDMLKAMVK